MEEPIPATCLNDFIFCPASIYFHRFYDGFDVRVFQRTDQVNGTSAHEAVDTGKYSTSKDVITALDGYSEKYNLTCKIDTFYVDKGLLVERKKKIKQIFDGYIFQLYAQYFCLTELGYAVNKMQLYSMDDNRKYDVDLPEANEVMFEKFKATVDAIINFDLENFKQTNRLKCLNCIYEPACDRTLVDEVNEDA